MASRKIYFTAPESQADLEIFRNKDGQLFVSLTDSNSQSFQFIALPEEDAKEIVNELLLEFDMVKEDEATGDYILKEDPC